MSDIQYKSTREGRFNVAEGNYTPNIPMGTIDMINDKYRQWLVRRGFASEESLNTFNGQLRGVCKRRSKAKKNKKTDEASSIVQDIE